MVFHYIGIFDFKWREYLSCPKLQAIIIDGLCAQIQENKLSKTSCSMEEFLLSNSAVHVQAGIRGNTKGETVENYNSF
jgi:hypothetical protein